MLRPLLAAGLLFTGLAAASTASLAQGVPPGQRGDYGCEVGFDTPCRGRLDFEQGSTYEFKIAGPGDVTITNEGNKRCRLQYSATNSTVATTGRELNLAPSEAQTITVDDTTGLILRFFNQGFGSMNCDLLVTLAKA